MNKKLFFIAFALFFSVINYSSDRSSDSFVFEDLCEVVESGRVSRAGSGASAGNSFSSDGGSIYSVVSAEISARLQISPFTPDAFWNRNSDENIPRAYEFDPTIIGYYSDKCKSVYDRTSKTIRLCLVKPLEPLELDPQYYTPLEPVKWSMKDDKCFRGVTRQTIGDNEHVFRTHMEVYEELGFDDIMERFKEESRQLSLTATPFSTTNRSPSLATNTAASPANVLSVLASTTSLQSLDAQNSPDVNSGLE